MWACVYVDALACLRRCIKASVQGEGSEASSHGHRRICAYVRADATPCLRGCSLTSLRTRFLLGPQMVKPRPQGKRRRRQVFGRRLEMYRGNGRSDVDFHPKTYVMTTLIYNGLPKLQKWAKKGHGSFKG